MANTQQMVIRKNKYSDAWATDNNALAPLLLAQPAKLLPVLTKLGGMDDENFPLTFATEGMGAVRSIDKDEYEYDVVTRYDFVRRVSSTIGSAQGKGGATFYIPLEDKYFVKDFVLFSQSGNQVRIMGEPIPAGNDTYKYPVQIIDPSPESVIPAADLVAGAKWVQLFAPVGVDWSRGNATNFEVPGKVRHKIGTIRRSYKYSGSMQEYVADINLPTKSGTTRMWMDYEEYRTMMKWQRDREYYYWYAEQTYDVKGDVKMRDENNQPVIVPPGVLQQIQNVDTYAQFTAGKLKNTVRNIFSNMTSRFATSKQITLMTGLGGKEEFHEALKEELNNNSFTVVDSKFIKGEGRALTLTGYFTTYEHIDGYTISVVHNPMFDNGPVAQVRERHPITGLSMESHRMVFLDQSMYDGEPNLMLVNRQGREFKKWAVTGSIVPRGFGSEANLMRSSDVDGASVHYLKQGGILLREFSTSIDMQCSLS